MTATRYANNLQLYRVDTPQYARAQAAFFLFFSLSPFMVLYVHSDRLYWLTFFCFCFVVVVVVVFAKLQGCAATVLLWSG